MQGDGKALIAGRFGAVNGVSRVGLARLNADGSLDRDFGENLIGPNGFVSFVSPDEDGRVVVAGAFTAINGVRVPSFARLWGNSESPPWVQIKSLERSETEVSLRWYAKSNQTYRVQFKTGFSTSPWTELAGDIRATSSIASKTDTTVRSSAQRFYRILMLP